MINVTEGLAPGMFHGGDALPAGYGYDGIAQGGSQPTSTTGTPIDGNGTVGPSNSTAAGASVLPLDFYADPRGHQPTGAVPAAPPAGVPAVIEVAQETPGGNLGAIGRAVVPSQARFAQFTGQGGFTYRIYTDANKTIEVVAPGKPFPGTQITPTSHPVAYHRIMGEYLARISAEGKRADPAILAAAMDAMGPAASVPVSASASATQAPSSTPQFDAGSAPAAEGEQLPAIPAEDSLAQIRAVVARVPKWVWWVGGTVALLSMLGGGVYVVRNNGMKAKEAS